MKKGSVAPELRSGNAGDEKISAVLLSRNRVRGSLKLISLLQAWFEIAGFDQSHAGEVEMLLGRGIDLVQGEVLDLLFALGVPRVVAPDEEVIVQRARDRAVAAAGNLLGLQPARAGGFEFFGGKTLLGGAFDF